MSFKTRPNQNLFHTDNPKKFGKALRYNLKGFWRYRVENYRIIAKIERDELAILIVQLYKRDKIEKYELVILIIQIDKRDKIYI